MLARLVDRRAELYCRLEKHGNPFFTSLRRAAYPFVGHLPWSAGVSPFGRVGNPEASAPGHAVEYHEMILIPVENCWGVDAGEFFGCDFGGGGFEPQCSGGFGNTFERYAFIGGKAEPLKG